MKSLPVGPKSKQLEKLRQTVQIMPVRQPAIVNLLAQVASLLRPVVPLSEREVSMLDVSADWKKAYPDAHVGILALSNVTNPDRHPNLEREKEILEADLRALFKDPSELKHLHPIMRYQAYYKRFKKTYHVLPQLQSVVFKGKSIPRVAILVESMFMEELRNTLLTAGHDLDLVKLPLKLDVAKGDEKYIKISGAEQTLKQGDMFIADSEAVMSSIIYGPDRRTMIRPSTTKVLFTVYGVPGIEEQSVLQHLRGIEANVRLVAPEASLDLIQVYGAGS